MLFVLSDDLLECSYSNNSAALEGVQNILLAARKGEHAVIASHRLLSYLAKIPQFSLRERGMANSLATRSAELPVLASLIRHKVFVHSGSDKALSLDADKCTWRIDASQLQQKFCRTTVVLAENMLDAELYGYAAKHYQLSKKINSLISTAETRGGGGSQIDVELQTMLRLGIPSLALTDGDHTCPGGEASAIAKRCARLVESEIGLGWHITLPTREIENIIPLTLLRDLADPQSSGETYDLLVELNRVASESHNPLSYACLKRGMTLKEVFSSSNLRHAAYWRQVALGIADNRAREFRTCLEHDECRKALCDCRVSAGFGENILSRVRDWLKERSAHESFKIFKKAEIWLFVGQLVFDVSVAFKRKVT